MARKSTATPAEQAPAEETTENPRTARSRAKLEQACELIRNYLTGKEWVPSKEIHRKFANQISEGMFGRAKAELGIVHRRTKTDKGVLYEWMLPQD